MMIHHFDFTVHDAPEPEPSTPEPVMVASRRRVRLGNGHTVTVRIVRPETADPWSIADETALRAILDVAADAARNE